MADNDTLPTAAGARLAARAVDLGYYALLWWGIIQWVLPAVSTSLHVK